MRGDDLIVAVEADELEAVGRQLNFKIERFEDVTGGTSALTKLAYGSAQSAFLKSYRGAWGRERLDTEVRLLNAACGGLVDVRLLEIGEAFQGPWMAMEELRAPDVPLVPQMVRALISAYAENIRTAFPAALPQQPGLRALLDVASQAVGALEVRREIDGRMAEQVRAALVIVSRTIAQARPVICHGDLSPGNIMQKRDGVLVAVDWEDSIVGFDGYDYLYWLTFMDNRQFYKCPQTFGATGLGLEVEKSVMLFIVLLKGYISLLRNTLKKNKVSLMDRLNEILSI